MDQTTMFEGERPRLVRLAARILNDHAEAEDVVQQAWLRLHTTHHDVADLPAWLTTVTTRLCLDRLRAKVPVAEDPGARALDVDRGSPGGNSDPAEEIALAETVGVALQAILDRLTPAERVAFVLHDSFGFDFATIASMLDSTPAAARKLASRARAKVAQPAPEDALADWEVVDAFLAAARGGDLTGLLGLLAPDVVVTGDRTAVAMGTPARLSGAKEVAGFFAGAAKAALPVFVDARPGAAWFHRGEARVAFDFSVVDGVVARIEFRAEPELLTALRPRRDDAPVDRDAPD